MDLAAGIVKNSLAVQKNLKFKESYSFQGSYRLPESLLIKKSNSHINPTILKNLPGVWTFQSLRSFQTSRFFKTEERSIFQSLLTFKNYLAFESLSVAKKRIPSRFKNSTPISLLQSPEAHQPSRANQSPRPFQTSRTPQTSSDLRSLLLFVTSQDN